MIFFMRNVPLMNVILPMQGNNMAYHFLPLFFLTLLTEINATAHVCFFSYGAAAVRAN